MADELDLSEVGLEEGRPVKDPSRIVDYRA
jgi:hypothetical protein